MVEWRPVLGFEGCYEVSDEGEVRRSGKAARTGNGRGGGARLGRVLRQHVIRNGYLAVQLWKDGCPTMRLAHVLVAEAFIGPRPPGKEVNHKDGIKTSNSAWNLEWVTRSDNNRHAWATGLRQYVDWRAGRTHCARGHLWEGNLVIRKSGQRRCAECNRINARNSRARRLSRG